MTTSTKIQKSDRSPLRAGLVVTASALTAVLLSACAAGQDPGGHVAGWAMISHAQRHPIVVSEQATSHSVRVPRGSDGLSPYQRASLADFISRYRGGDTSGRLSIAVPSGSHNEVSALKAVSDLRDVARDYGIDDSRIAVSPYRAAGDNEPAIRVSFTRYVAQGPECGAWPANLADDTRNLPYANFGCSTQRNFAAQVANPADLLNPRTMTPATSEQRDMKWEKFNRGETTVTKKDSDERASVKSN